MEQSMEAGFDEWGHIPLLVTLPVLVTYEEVELPDSWAEGQERWDLAFAQYEEDEMAEAATLFLEAANAMRTSALTEEQEELYAESIATARSSCYQNAWECFQGAGQPDQGHQALQAAAQQDAPCAGDIRDLLTD